MKKVAICGVGSSLRNFDWGSDYEVWGLNHHKNKFKRWNLWWNLHTNEFIENTITQINYPYEQAYKLRNIPVEGRSNIRYKYFASSMSYMTAYAILKGYDEILYCGCDFATKDEIRTKQKECLEQWIAFAQGRGISIKVIADSPLCSETGLYIYGINSEKEKICG